MKKALFLIIVVFCLSYSCSNAEAKQKNNKSNVFDKIDKRDKKLFTQTEKINSYNKSINNSNLNNKAPKGGSSYSGYGSLNNKKIQKTNNQTFSKKKKISKPKMSNAGFSAYSTN
ncbi:MAG: hypothetical protein CMC63_03175 [Flavobacteriaceae bacterium]|nr:hypothetical protein [Flavobacteriaceae bacterium]|tara:strand:- start:51 stop:395 length:345 start_codon:yes stop_codon:yes gene_type:complete